MRWRLGDILACPECSHSPLRIQALNINQSPPGSKAFLHECTNYCARVDRVISETINPEELPCKECQQLEIEEGVIKCAGCRRWFAVLKGIPHLVRDGLRLIREEQALLRRHQARLSPEILNEGIPLNLRPAEINPSPADKQILTEGEYWGEFFRAYYAVGDTSILDIRSRGKHPPFLNYGVGEVDDLEKRRRWGPWPRHLGRMLFVPLRHVRGKRGLDFGCGGGQFALEAAYQGVNVVGFDISPQSLSIAREYARSVGLDNQYVYAESGNLPFRPKVFSLLMCKDSLHHLPDPERAIKKVKSLLLPDALVIIIEHIGNSVLAKRVYDFFASRLIPKIQQRYKRVEVAPVLLRGAPHEDFGMAKVERALRENFYIVKERYEWMLYLRLEQLFHFAFGKRRWLSYTVSILTRVFERSCLLFARPEHLVLVAKNRL